MGGINLKQDKNSGKSQCCVAESEMDNIKWAEVQNLSPTVKCATQGKQFTFVVFGSS
jgi:hypothetical protein